MSKLIKNNYVYELHNSSEITSKIKPHIKKLYGGTRLNIKVVDWFSNARDLLLNKTYTSWQYIIYNDKLYYNFDNFRTEYTDNYICLMIINDIYLFLDEDSEKYTFVDMGTGFGHRITKYITFLSEPRPIFLLSPTKFKEQCNKYNIYNDNVINTRYNTFELCLEYFSQKFLKELRDN